MYNKQNYIKRIYNAVQYFEISVNFELRFYFFASKI